MKKDKQLRSREEINKEYTECAVKLGDFILKSKLMDEEAERLKIKMILLAREESAPILPPADLSKVSL